MPTNKKKAPIPLSQVPKPAKWFNWVSVYTIEEQDQELIIKVEQPFLKKYFSLWTFFPIGMGILFSLALIDTVRNFETIDHPYESLFTCVIFIIVSGGVSYFILSQQLDTITIKVSPHKISMSEKPLIKRQQEWLSDNILFIQISELEGEYYIQLMPDNEALHRTTLFMVQTETEADWFCAKLNKILKKKRPKI